MTTNPLDSLSVQHRLFVEEYFACDYNAAEACTKAGYKTKYPNKYGYELLNKPHIKAAVDYLAQRRLEEVTVKPDYVLRKAVKLIERADQDNNPNAALRGLELLARHLGMLTDKQEITGKDGAAIQYEKIEDDAKEFTRAIVGLANRSRANDNPEREDAKRTG